MHIIAIQGIMSSKAQLLVYCCPHPQGYYSADTDTPAFSAGRSCDISRLTPGIDML